MTPAVKALPLQQSPVTARSPRDTQLRSGTCPGTPGRVGAVPGRRWGHSAGRARGAPRDATALAALCHLPAAHPGQPVRGVGVAASPPGRGVGAPSPGREAGSSRPLATKDTSELSLALPVGGQSLVPLPVPRACPLSPGGVPPARPSPRSGAPSGSWLLVPRSASCSRCSRTNTTPLSLLTIFS